jgi:hypothetical protein
MRSAAQAPLTETSENRPCREIPVKPDRFAVPARRFPDAEKQIPCSGGQGSSRNDLIFRGKSENLSTAKGPVSMEFPVFSL